MMKKNIHTKVAVALMMLCALVGLTSCLNTETEFGVDVKLVPPSVVRTELVDGFYYSNYYRFQLAEYNLQMQELAEAGLIINGSDGEEWRVAVRHSLEELSYVEVKVDSMKYNVTYRATPYIATRQTNGGRLSMEIRGKSSIDFRQDGFKLFCIEDFDAETHGDSVVVTLNANNFDLYRRAAAEKSEAHFGVVLESKDDEYSFTALDIAGMKDKSQTSAYYHEVLPSDDSREVKLLFKNLRGGKDYSCQLYCNGVEMDDWAKEKSLDLHVQGCKVSVEGVDLGRSFELSPCNFGANDETEFGFTTMSSSDAPYNTHYRPAKRDYGFNNYGNDVVTWSWGGEWRCMTEQELLSLRNNCNWVMVWNGDQKGYYIMGSTGAKVFLPTPCYLAVGSNVFYKIDEDVVQRVNAWRVPTDSPRCIRPVRTKPLR